MKKLSLASLSLLLLTMSSCELIGDIFEMGVWVGIILVVAVLGLIIFILRKIMGR